MELKAAELAIVVQPVVLAVPTTFTGTSVEFVVEKTADGEFPAARDGWAGTRRGARSTEVRVRRPAGRCAELRKGSYENGEGVLSGVAAVPADQRKAHRHCDLVGR
jgi:hypothetical protein